MRRGTLASILLVAALALGPNALAVPGDIILASTSDIGTKGNGDSLFPAMSADSTRVAFHSIATNLDPADTDSVNDVYVKDLSTGDTTLASTSDTGTKGNGDSLLPALSADGTSVAFYSFATNLDPGDTDGLADVYVKDLLTGDITLASTSVTGTKGNGDSFDPGLSADGTRVAFESFATNLDPAPPDPDPAGDTVMDIYVKNLVTGDIMLASITRTGVKGDQGSLNPELSANGTRVAFDSEATNLIPDPDCAGEAECEPEVYVKDLGTGDLVVASSSDTGTPSSDTSEHPDISADGMTVAFGSFASNLDPASTGTIGDVYVKDLLTGDIMLASTSDAGTPGDGQSLDAAISADGTRVAFGSASTNLDPADTDATVDVYVKNLSTGDVTLASTSDAGVKGNADSLLPDLSADGAKVAFLSVATNLDPGDTDSIQDIYVKELGGPPPPPEADMGVSIADKPDPVVKGQTLSYRLAITNHGPDVATGVTLTDTFAGSQFVSVSTSQGSCMAHIKQRTVTCDLGSLADNAFATVRVLVRPQRTGTVTNTASVSANEPDPDPSNNSDSESTSVVSA